MTAKRVGRPKGSKNATDVVVVERSHPAAVALLLWRGGEGGLPQVRQQPAERILGPHGPEVPRPPRRQHALRGHHSPAMPVFGMRAGAHRQGVSLVTKPNCGNVTRARQRRASGAAICRRLNPACYRLRAFSSAATAHSR